jgi:iron complex transport system permease protein
MNWTPPLGRRQFMIATLHSRSAKISGLFLFALLLLLCFMASILLGAKAYSLNTLTDAYLSFDGSNDHLIIRQARVPRALIATVIGAGLAVAGTLMQALTRNPLASPSLFGINAGAALAIVVSVAFFQVSSMLGYMTVAFVGAALSAILVFILGAAGSGGMTPVKMTLAGAAITAFASSLTSGVLLGNNKAFDQVLFWLIGSIANRELEMLTTVLPYMTAAFIAAYAIAVPVNILTMGDDVARGLGQRTFLVKLIALAAIVLLAGGAVAVAGPISFIGIVIPHIGRYFVGTDHRWLIPYSAVLGAILLVSADIGARFLLAPSEVPVGALTALIGIPFFVFIARRGSYE